MTYATTSINPFYAARLTPVAPRPDAGAGQPDLRPAATGTDHRQPGAAPDQPVPFPPGRRIRRPEMARQLRRQPDQGFADLLSSPGLVFDPMTGSGTCRDVCEELGIPCMAWDIHQGFDACDPQGFPGSGDVRFHLGTSALLAAEALRRRSPRPVAHARRWSISSALRPVHPQLCP